MSLYLHDINQIQFTEDFVVNPFCLPQTWRNIVFLITTKHTGNSGIDQDDTLLQLLDRSGALSWSILLFPVCFVAIKNTIFLRDCDTQRGSTIKSQIIEFD